MNTLLKKKLLATAVTVGLVMASSVSHASLFSSPAVLNQLMTTGTNQFQDTNADRILRLDPNGTVTSGTNKYSVITSGNLQNGDIFQAVLRFTDINAQTVSDLGGDFAAPYALLAFSELQITNISAADSNGFVSFDFAATGNLSGSQVLADFYEQGTPGDTENISNLFTTLTPDQAIAEVTDGGFIGGFGLGALGNDFWKGGSLLDIGLIASAPSGSPQQAAGVFGLTLLSNPGLLPFIPEGILSPIDGKLHTIVGSASAYVRDSNANSGWLISSNTEARGNVPEPSTLGLLGTAILLGGMAQRRRKV